MDQMSHMMHHAVCVSKIFGPFLAIIGIWMLLYSENLLKVTSAIKSSPAAFYILGFINLLVGLVIVNTYNVWMSNLAVLVTLLGWVTTVRGACFFFVPQLVVKYTMGTQKTAQGMGLVPLVWGLLLCWIGFHS